MADELATIVEQLELDAIVEDMERAAPLDDSDRLALLERIGSKPRPQARPGTREYFRRPGITLEGKKVERKSPVVSAFDQKFPGVATLYDAKRAHDALDVHEWRSLMAQMTGNKDLSNIPMFTPVQARKFLTDYEEGHRATIADKLAALGMAFVGPAKYLMTKGQREILEGAAAKGAEELSKSTLGTVGLMAAGLPQLALPLKVGRSVGVGPIPSLAAYSAATTEGGIEDRTRAAVETALFLGGVGIAGKVGRALTKADVGPVAARVVKAAGSDAAGAALVEAAMGGNPEASAILFGALGGVSAARGRPNPLTGVGKPPRAPERPVEAPVVQEAAPTVAEALYARGGETVRVEEVPRAKEGMSPAQHEADWIARRREAVDLAEAETRHVELEQRRILSPERPAYFRESPLSDVELRATPAAAKEPGLLEPGERPFDPTRDPIQADVPTDRPKSPGGIYLGAGLGGASPKVALGAAKIVGSPSRGVHKVLSLLDTGVNKAVGKIRDALERMTGESFTREPGIGATLRSRRNVFRGESEAGREVGRFAASDLSRDSEGKRITPEQAETAFRYLTGEGSRESVEALAGKEYADTATKYRERINANETELLDLGGISKETYDKWFGKWLPRRFTAIEAGKEAPDVSRTGIRPTRIFRRKDLSKERLEELGEIRDPASVVGHALAMQESSLAALRFMRDASLDTRLSSTEPIEGFASDPLPNNPARYGLLAGKYVHPKLERDLNGMYRGKASDLGEWIGRFSDGLLSDWKMATTALNPATNVRNIIGSSVFKELDHYSWLDPANLSHTKAAIDALRGRRYASVEMGPGEHMDARDVKILALKERLIRSDYASTDVLDLAEQVYGTHGRTWKERVGTYLKDKGSLLARGRLIEVLPGVGDVAQLQSKLYGLEDTVTKVGSFVKKMREGMSPQEAGQAVRDAYPIFGEGYVSDLQRRGGPVGRQLLPPFLSFTENAARIFTKASMDKPVTTAVVVSALIEGLNAITRSAGLDEEDIANLRKMLPAWLAPGATRPVVKADKSKGIYRILDESYTIPLANEIEGVVRRFHGDTDTGAPFGFSPGPVPNAIYEWVSGKRYFTGKDYIPKGAGEAETRQLKLKNLGENLIPSNPFIPGSRSFNRIAEATEEEKPLVRLSKIGGISLRDVNAPEQAQRMLRSLAAKQDDAIGRISAIGRDTRISETDKRKRIDDLIGEIEARGERMREVEEAAKREEKGR